MARRSAEVQITLEGRDKGKKFRLTEMPAMQAEKWATRAILAFSHSGVQIDEEVAEGGWASLAAMGIKMLGGVDFAQAEPLLDEMMQQVMIVEEKITRPITPDDIDEVGTVVFLRGEVLALHMGFPLGVAISKLRALAPQPSDTPDTEMSLTA